MNSQSVTAVNAVTATSRAYALACVRARRLRMCARARVRASVTTVTPFTRERKDMQIRHLSGDRHPFQAVTGGGHPVTG